MIWIKVLAIFTILLASCSNSQTSGTTIETENAISLQIFSDNNLAVQNAQVRIRPLWYIADTTKSKTLNLAEICDHQSDSKGMVRCDNLPKGQYQIEIISDGHGATATFKHFDTLELQTIEPINLEALSSIKGKVQLPENANYAWVQIYGMERIVKTDSKGNYQFDSIPSGIFRIRAITYSYSSIIAEDYVKVVSGYPTEAGTMADPSVYLEDPENWRYSKMISIESLISEWMKPVSDPYVLTLRLNQDNFDFSQAMSDGRDIRLFDEKGNRLLYQIAQWDTKIQKGVLRIRIDDMSSAAEIELRWGCPGAISLEGDNIWMNISDSLQKELYSVLVSDFEEKTSQTQLAPPIPSTFWYIVLFDSTVVSTPSPDDDFSLGIVPADSGRTGNAYHINYQATENKYIFLGAAISSATRDLATMDSVEFWSRGNGVLYFALDDLSDNGGKALYSDSLSENWVRTCIRPSDFDEPNNIGGNIGWEAVKNSVSNFTFFGINGTDLWIDDFRIYGINRDDLK